MVTQSVRYLTCAETAKLVRAALKKNFPGVKFSVRSDVYSMGASIDVTWALGPTTKEVEAIAKQYESADFDGSIDLEVLSNHWLLPNGTAIIRKSPGTQGSMGCIPAESNAPPPGAEPVSFGAHYVQCQRRYADDWHNEQPLIERVAQDMCKLNLRIWSGPHTTGLYGEHDFELVTPYACRLLNATSFKPGESYAGVRWATEEERNKLDSIMVVIKESYPMAGKC